MSDVQVRHNTLSASAYALFDILYHKGPVSDEDLDSKVAMKELMDLGLAKKDPEDTKRNMLTKLGMHDAGVHYTEIAVREQQAKEARTVKDQPVTLNIPIVDREASEQ